MRAQGRLSGEGRGERSRSLDGVLQAEGGTRTGRKQAAREATWGRGGE